MDQLSLFNNDESLRFPEELLEYSEISSHQMLRLRYSTPFKNTRWLQTNITIYYKGED